MMVIDVKNFSILKIIEESEKPAYKSDIQRKMERQIEGLPIEEGFSVQTVCRRVRELEEEKYVDPTIIKSEKTNRVFIKAYQLTEKGKKHLEDFREKILLRKASKYINSHLRSDEEEPDINEKFVKEAVCKTFDLPMEEDLEDLECVLPAVFLYYSRREIQNKIERPVFQEFADRISRHNPELAESLRAHATGPSV